MQGMTGPAIAVIALLAASAVAQAPAARATQRIADWPADPYAAMAKLPLQAPATEGRTITVCTADDTPVADADLIVVASDCVDLATKNFLALRGVDDGDLPAKLGSRFGRRYRTGADGSVTVAQGGWYVAFVGDQSGVRWDEDKPLRVSIAPRSSIAVEVVDSDGRPVADVDVVAAIGGAQVEAIARTGVDGRARLRLRGASPPTSPMTVSTLVAGGAVRARVPDGYFGKPPALLSLHLPAAGSVDVRVFDDAGKPATDVTWVSLGGDEQSGLRAAPVELRADGGRFLCARIGAELAVQVTFAGVQGAVEAFGNGPTRAGETVRLDVRLKDCAPIVRARVFDPAGKVLAGATLEIWACSQRSFGSSSWRTDDSGRLAFALERRSLREATEPRLVMLLRSTLNRATVYGGAAIVPLRPDQCGMLDLGDLHLQVEPPVVAGQTVDPDGKPVAGVLVGAPMSLHVFPDGVRFAGLSGHTARTDADGRFVLREFAPQPVALDLSIKDDSWRLDSPVSAPALSADVKLVAVRSGSLDLQLAVPGPALDFFAFELQRRGTTEVVHAKYTGGRAHAEGLAPGIYDLQCRLAVQLHIEVDRRDDPFLVFAIDGLEVRSGAPCSDARLTAYDWHKKLTTAPLRVQDENRQPLPAVVEVSLAGVSVLARCDAQGSTEVPLLVPKLPIAPHELQIVARCDGYRSANVPIGTPPLTVTLRPRARLHLTPPAGVQLPEGIVLRFTGKGSFGDWRPEQVLRPDGSGKTEVGLCLWRAQGGYEDLWRGEVAMPDDDKVHDIELPVDATVVERAKAIVDEVNALRARQQGR